jgi:hypothetical protein
VLAICCTVFPSIIATLTYTFAGTFGTVETVELVCCGVLELGAAEDDSTGSEDDVISLEVPLEFNCTGFVLWPQADRDMHSIKTVIHNKLFLIIKDLLFL